MLLTLRILRLWLNRLVNKKVLSRCGNEYFHRHIQKRVCVCVCVCVCVWMLLAHYTSGLCRLLYCILFRLWCIYISHTHTHTHTHTYYIYVGYYTVRYKWRPKADKRLDQQTWVQMCSWQKPQLELIDSTGETHTHNDPKASLSFPTYWITFSLHLIKLQTAQEMQTDHFLSW